MQSSLVQPENIQGHEASNLQCDNETTWIDTAKSGPTVKRLKLSRAGKRGHQAQQHDVQKQQDNGDTLMKKSKRATKGTKRVRTESKDPEQIPGREESQRTVSAKEQLDNPEAKKGTVEFLCIDSASCKNVVLIQNSQSHSCQKQPK